MSLSLFSRFYNTVRVSFALPKNDNWRETEMKGMKVGQPHFVPQTGLPRYVGRGCAMGDVRLPDDIFRSLAALWS